MKAVFSATVTIVLLAIYVYLVARGIQVANCIEAQPACTALDANDFNDRMASALALIGGLVSALVIAELSVTQPGQAPAARLLSKEIAEKRKRLLHLVTGLYLVVWLAAGLSAFLFGYLALDPETLPPLSALGQGWLGIAAGAGYAYFGIKRP